MLSADVLDLIHILKCSDIIWKSQLYIPLLVSRINPPRQKPRRLTDLTQLLCLYLLRKLKVPGDWLNKINRLGLTLWVICPFPLFGPSPKHCQDRCHADKHDHLLVDYHFLETGLTVVPHFKKKKKKVEVKSNVNT